jgi:hypothetical protein
MAAVAVAPGRLSVSRRHGGWEMGVEGFQHRGDPIWAVWGGRGSPRKLLHGGTVQSKENGDGGMVRGQGERLRVQGALGRQCGTRGGGGRARVSQRCAVNNEMIAWPGKCQMASAASDLVVARVGLRRARHDEVGGGMDRRLFW